MVEGVHFGIYYIQHPERPPSVHNVLVKNQFFLVCKWLSGFSDDQSIHLSKCRDILHRKSSAIFRDNGADVIIVQSQTQEPLKLKRPQLLMIYQKTDILSLLRNHSFNGGDKAVFKAFNRPVELFRSIQPRLLYYQRYGRAVGVILYGSIWEEDYLGNLAVFHIWKYGRLHPHSHQGIS